MTIVKVVAASAATSVALWAVPALSEKWDMPMGYSAANFHSVTGAEFGKCVTRRHGWRVGNCYPSGRFAIQG